MKKQRREGKGREGKGRKGDGAGDVPLPAACTSEVLMGNVVE